MVKLELASPRVHHDPNRVAHPDAREFRALDRGDHLAGDGCGLSTWLGYSALCWRRH